MADVILTGLAANDPVPGNYVEINFAQGESSNGQGIYGTLMMGNKTSAGSATVDTVVYGPTSATQLQTEADAIALFGTGSELHTMIADFMKVNPDTPVYAIAVTESGGTAASRDHVVATTATANGNIRFYFGDEFVDTAVASGDTAGTICTNIVASINSKTKWQVTAAVVTTTTVRVTARHKGPRGNWLRTMVVLQGSFSTTVSNSASGFLASGATADDNTAALATIAGTRYYYTVSAAEDATQLGALATQTNANAAPTVGICSRVFAGSNDTSGNAITVATGINGARVEIGWLAQSDVPPHRIAARLAAVYSKWEAGAIPRCNFSGFGNADNESADWRVRAPLSGAVPTRATIKSLLQNGVTPIGCNANGSTYIVKRITTRCLNGSNPDFRIRDGHKVTVMDRLADDWKAKCAAQYTGKKIGDDPAPGARTPGAEVVTPRVVKAGMTKLLRDYEGNDLLENVDATIDGMNVSRSSSPTTRMGVRVKVDVIDILDQVSSAFDQVG